MRLEGSQDFEGRGQNSDNAIVTPKKEILRARAGTADFVVFEERLALVVGGAELVDLEEIERFPLYFP